MTKKMSKLELFTSKKFHLIAGLFLLLLANAAGAQDVATAGAGDLSNQSQINLSGTPDSEFDNHSPNTVVGHDQADPDYEDSEFGELLYNEASISTKLELLRLLSKGTPSMMVFMHAISMGLGVEDILEASVNYDPSHSRDFAQSAISLLPLLSGSTSYIYDRYELDDLKREDENKPYLIQDVANRFFDDREVLVPYPDWIEGQFHFEASASELRDLQRSQQSTKKWYRSRSDVPVSNRPVFVSLYEWNQTILIDSPDRIDQALEDNGPDATMPVVFIYNRLNERPIDDLGYEMTLRGIQTAYSENALMVTPAPEWQIGEYHIYSKMEELYEIFEIPAEEDFEPEQWQGLLAEAENYKVANTSFLFVMLGAGNDNLSQLRSLHGQQFAQYDDPRTEANFPYAGTKDGSLNLNALLGQGVIVNRPDLIAALNTLGVLEIPSSIYYIDNNRVKPFIKGPRALQAIVDGIRVSTPNGGGGGFGPPPEDPPEDCASPPCNTAGKR